MPVRYARSSTHWPSPMTVKAGPHPNVKDPTGFNVVPVDLWSRSPVRVDRGGEPQQNTTVVAIRCVRLHDAGTTRGGYGCSRCPVDTAAGILLVSRLGSRSAGWWCCGSPLSSRPGHWPPDAAPRTTRLPLNQPRPRRSRSLSFLPRPEVRSPRPRRSGRPFPVAPSKSTPVTWPGRSWTSVRRAGTSGTSRTSRDLRADIDQLVTLFDGTTRADEVGRLYGLFGAALDERTTGSDSRRWWVTIAGLITNGDQARSFEDPLPGYLNPNDHGAGGAETPKPSVAQTATTPSVATALAHPSGSVPPSVSPTAAPVGTDNPNDFQEAFFDCTYQVPVGLAPGLLELTPANNGSPCRVYLYSSDHTGRAYTVTATTRVRLEVNDTELTATGCTFHRVAH